MGGICVVPFDFFWILIRGVKLKWPMCASIFFYFLIVLGGVKWGGLCVVPFHIFLIVLG